MIFIESNYTKTKIRSQGEKDEENQVKRIKESITELEYKVSKSTLLRNIPKDKKAG